MAILKQRRPGSGVKNKRQSFQNISPKVKKADLIKNLDKKKLHLWMQDTRLLEKADKEKAIGGAEPLYTPVHRINR